jgi:3-deoxy-D-manno-octulosonic acid kinase
VEASATMAPNNPQIVYKNKSYIIYDASIITDPQPDLFDPLWLEQHADVTHNTQGRGAAWLIDYQQYHWVLRQYKRGGLIARWNKEHYLGWSIKKTRAWKEWHLLNTLYALGLSVPQPVAAQVSWPLGKATGFYKAAILLNKISDAKTLAEKIQKKELDSETWNKVGQCIRLFHNQGVYHADLNANNILFDGHEKIYLIDFDRGCIKQTGAWKNENIKRLRRSLMKLKNNHSSFYFTEDNWSELVLGYGSLHP